MSTSVSRNSSATVSTCPLQHNAVVLKRDHHAHPSDRGVYEAALELYDSFASMVSEHLERHPDAKVQFTGHSLGGSLATVLMLLLVHR